MSDLDETFGVPRKLFDEKRYVRVDTASGAPQLVRLVPILSEDGQELLSENVRVFVDDMMEMLMDREAAEEWIRAAGCVPLAETTNHKQNIRH